MADVVWRRSAIESLNRIIAYIRLFDPVAADDYAVRLTILGESLSAFPNRGRPVSDGTRELATVPPYIIRYRVDADRVWIETVRHGRRQDDRPDNG